MSAGASSATTWVYRLDNREAQPSAGCNTSDRSLAYTTIPNSPGAGRHAVLAGFGLTTPPADDDMSTTYQPTLAAYDSHAAHNYPASLGHVNRSKAAVADSRNPNYYRYAQHQVPVPQPAASTTQHQLRSNNNIPVPQQVAGVSYEPPKQLTPTSEVTMPAQSASTSRRGSESLIYHSLQVPMCISPTGGNLADFAAQVRPLLQPFVSLSYESH